MASAGAVKRKQFSSLGARPEVEKPAGRGACLLDRGGGNSSAEPGWRIWVGGTDRLNGAKSMPADVARAQTRWSRDGDIDLLEAFAVYGWAHGTRVC